MPEMVSYLSFFLLKANEQANHALNNKNVNQIAAPSQLHCCMHCTVHHVNYVYAFVVNVHMYTLLKPFPLLVFLFLVPFLWTETLFFLY